jgi:hypothetical protein
MPLRRFSFWLLLVLAPFWGMAQCPGSDGIREVTFEVQGSGLRQFWEFSTPSGEMDKVEVAQAHWIDADAVLLWGYVEAIPHALGLYLLERSESFGVTSWTCTWEIRMDAAQVGDYRALVPVVADRDGGYRLLAIDVQDETSTGTILVEWKDGMLLREVFVRMVRLERVDYYWIHTCPTVDSVGAVHFQPDVYRQGWGEGERALVDRELVLPVGKDSVAANPLTYAPSKQKGVRYRQAYSGDIVLAPGSRIPIGKRLEALAEEIQERYGLESVRILTSETVLEATILSMDDPERYQGVIEAGVIWDK